MNHPALAAVPFRSQSSALPSSGVVRVSVLTRERPARDRMGATSSVQTVLEFDDPAPASFRPHLRLVSHDDARIDQMATRFAQAVVEVFGGDRGPFQLMRWTTAEVYAEVTRRSTALNQIAAAPRGRRLRAQVRSVHLSVPHAGVAELSIHVRHGARSRAIAARMEVVEGRWKCSALEFGP